MLTTIFKSIFGISLSLTPIILFLLALGPLLQKRYTPKLRYFIWLFVAVRLLLPISFQNTARVIIPAGEAVFYLQNDSAAVARAFAEAEAAANTDVQDITPVAAQTAISWIGILAMIWIAGAALYLIWQIASYFIIQHRFSRWSIPIHNEDTQNMFEEIKHELGIKKRIEVYQSEYVSGPLLIGFINPRIIIPMIAIERTHLRGILRHELLHYRRADLWYKLLMLFTAALHWFNPAVYLISKQAEMDMELACDGDVLNGADISSRKDYGLAILSLMQQDKRSRIPLTTYFFSSKKHMKQRFLGIIDASQKRKGLFAFCVSIAIVIIAGTFIGCGYLSATPLADTSTQLPPAIAAREVQEPTIPSQAVPDMQEMEGHFLEDLENNQAAQAKVQQEIDEVYEKIKWSNDAYLGGEMAWPVPGFYNIASAYGLRFDVADFHTGIDISGEEIYGAHVIAAESGTVLGAVTTGYHPGIGYGMYVVIDHGGDVSTLYGHLSEILVSVGDEVKRGQVIAKVGSTGFSMEPHLQFEVRIDGTHVNPQPYLIGESVGLIWPTSGGKVVAGVDSYPGHTGIDIAQPEGTPVYASAAGTVTESKITMTGCGNYIIIDHGNGYETLYAHNSNLYVSVGDAVGQGQVIASVGRSGNATGYQLHFEVRYNGRIMNPENYIVSRSE